MLTVHYLYEKDEVWQFPTEGTRITFGRDDDCDITIFSAINGDALSRVAGCIWRMEDELWLRNLSERHDLRIDVPGRPAASPLPPRRAGSNDPGPAQSIPGELAYVLGPDGCVLVVTQHRQAPPRTVVSSRRPTAAIPKLPPTLRPVAIALCAPLLRGGDLPASYAEVGEQLGGSYKSTRNLVAELTGHYLNEIPDLRERVEARRRIEEEKLGLPPGSARQEGLVWVFEQSAEESADEPTEMRRRRALALPDYYEVAHLLVRHHVVTVDDLQ